MFLIERLLKDIAGFSKEGFLKVVHGEAIGFAALLVYDIKFKLYWWRIPATKFQ